MEHRADIMGGSYSIMPLVFRLLPLMIGSALLAFAQPVIIPAVSTLPDGRVGSPYSYAFSAS